MTDEETFQQERASGIGGSDVAALFSLPPYGCERALWYEKRSVPPDFPPSKEQLRLMRRGTKLEDLIAEEYEEVSGREPLRFPMVRHPQYPYLIVHMDRLIRKTPETGFGYLECKSAGYGMFQKIKREGLPDSYILQVQHGMFVAGWQWGSYAIMDVANWRLIHFDIDADPEIQESIVRKAEEFWVKKENGPMPDQLPDDAVQCRRCAYRWTCKGNRLLTAQGEEKDSAAFEDAPELAPLINEALEVQEIEEEAHGLTEAAKQAVREALINPRKVRVPGAGASWIEYPERRLDMDAWWTWFDANPRVAPLFEKFITRTKKRTLTLFRC